MLKPLFILLNAHPAGDVPMGTTLGFCVLLVAMVLALALEQKIHAHKSVITGIAALLALVLGEAMVEKFSGDHIDEMKRNCHAYTHE